MPESYFAYRGNKSTTANTNIARSSSFWWNCPWEQIMNGEVEGCAQFYDFTRLKTSADINASEAYWSDGLFAYGTTTAPVTASDANGGGATIGSSGDNGGIAFRNPGAPFQIDRTTSEFWFEVLFKTSTIADAKHDIFVGLTESTAFSTAVPITTAGALADKNLVGFFRPETARTVAGTGGAIMNTVYKADGVTAVTVQTDAVTLVADTYIKLGMHYKREPDEYVEDTDVNRKFLLTFYANGVRCSTTKQIPSPAGTDFPNDMRLGFAIALMNATGSTPGTSTIRWARLAQLL